MTRLPIGLIGLSSGSTTSCPASRARAASSANVRPVTVMRVAVRELRVDEPLRDERACRRRAEVDGAVSGRPAACRPRAACASPIGSKSSIVSGTPALARDREEVQHRVRRAARRVHARDRVLDRLRA
jgi:hypothetical protein